MDSKKQLSIFTPTYNRAYILPELYNSLCRQTNKDFVWLVIDDGSTDDTKKLFSKWIDESVVEIVYIYQENSGKHTAINRAVENCDSKWMLFVDSDDFLTGDAVETIYGLIDEERNKEYIIGFAGPKGNINGESIYRNWPDVRYANFMDLAGKYNFYGETITIIDTEVLRKNRIPCFEGEKFVPENVMFYAINGIGPFRLFSKIIYCFEYRDDGYSKNALRLVINNPKGYMLSLKLEINGEKSIVYKGKCKAFYEAIRIVFLPDDKTKNEIIGNWMVMVLGTLFMPYYLIKLIYGILMSRKR